MLELLEERYVLAPATFTWVGPSVPPTGGQANSNWDNINNWNSVPAQGRAPGQGDKVIFDNASGANTDSTMNMGGGIQYQISGLEFKNEYSGTLTLTASLYTDYVNLAGSSSSHIAMGQQLGGRIPVLKIWQRTTDPAAGPAVNFQASFLQFGTVDPAINIYAEANHPATFNVGSGVAPVLNGQLAIQDPNGTVQWTQGSVKVKDQKDAQGNPIATLTTNGGTFIADSPGNTFGTGPGGARWILLNNVLGVKGKVIEGGGTLQNVRETGTGNYFKQRAGQQGQMPAGLSDDTFTVEGTVELDNDGTYAGSLEVQSGTLTVTDAVTMASGTSVTVDDTTDLEAQNGFTMSGGTLTVGAAQMNVTGVLEEDSGTFTLNSGAVSATGGLDIASAPATFSGLGSITADVTNNGAATVGGYGAVGTLHIVGNYTQTSGGSLFIDIAGTDAVDQLLIDGLATLNGYLGVGLLNGFTPTAGQTFTLITYGSRSGTFAFVSLPQYSGGYLTYQYDPFVVTAH